MPSKPSIPANAPKAPDAVPNPGGALVVGGDRIGPFVRMRCLVNGLTVLVGCGAGRVGVFLAGCVTGTSTSKVVMTSATTNVPSIALCDVPVDVPGFGVLVLTNGRPFRPRGTSAVTLPVIEVLELPAMPLARKLGRTAGPSFELPLWQPVSHMACVSHTLRSRML